MIHRHTQATLRQFEDDIKQCYLDKLIRAPIHLRSGYEEQLIALFEEVAPDDYVFGYWASHIHCLLKGVPDAELKASILAGNSISLCFPEHRIFCSGIAGSLSGVATGTALALKRRVGSERVWLFSGDMTAESGVFMESLKYSVNFDLPITFVVEDNGVSVITDTRATWGDDVPWFRGSRYEQKVRYFTYENGYPHSGIAVKVAF